LYVFPLSGWIQNKLDRAEPIVIEMHTANHLIAEMAKLQAQGNSMSYNYYKGCMEADILGWFEILGVPEHEVELAGSGVHFDRMFLREFCPQVEAFFHYRNWDTSVMKRMVQRWAPEYYRRNPLFEYESSHRALPDVMHSIEVTKLARNVVTMSESLWQKSEQATL